MKPRIIIIMIITLFFILSGCGYVLVRVEPGEDAETQMQVIEESEGAENGMSRYYYTTQSTGSISLTHADIANKREYINRANETLKNFCVIARDIYQRQDENSVKEIGREANSYVKIYIEPIINDSEAVGNLETRAEVAKLHLLSASLYFELAGYYQAKFYLERLTEQYDNDFLSSITLDQMHMGYSTVAEGVKELQKKITLRQMTTIETM